MSIWSRDRFPRDGAPIDGLSSQPDVQGLRSPFQHDYDRLLFSTPVRRLSDKTQVWPMDENDGVRTRLTHSHEVANLARSIGTRIAKAKPDLFGCDVGEVLQPILSAIGLAHDLGNPPFGHQGETAIGRWFTERQDWIFSNYRKGDQGLPISIPEPLRAEFLNFDGNPQAFRLLTKLQAHVANVGLDLTAATLAASLKYPVNAENRDITKPDIKKVGYFRSEDKIVKWMRSKTGLEEKQRHPLTWIMEACDDIAYSVLDVDDAMKKQILSPDDVIAILFDSEHPSCVKVVEKIKSSFEAIPASKKRAEVVRDIKIGFARAHLIEALVNEASDGFVANSIDVMALKSIAPLMENSRLCSLLKKIARQYAFSNTSVLKMEAVGASAIGEIMSFFWAAISDRKEFDQIDSRRKSATSIYGFSLISPNYIEDAIVSLNIGGAEGGVRYRELRLLTDMVSGMTDTFCLKLRETLKDVPGCL